MITTFAAYKEIIMTSSGRADPQSRKSGSLASVPTVAARAGNLAGVESANAVSVELSASSDVFSAVDNFFNLGGSSRFDSYNKLSPEDKKQFVKMVGELAKARYMGYEELIVENKVERHGIANQIGDRRLRNARIYDDSKHPRDGTR